MKQRPPNKTALRTAGPASALSIPNPVQHPASFAPVDHAKEVVRPVGKPPRSPVAQGYERLPGKGFAGAVRIAVGNVPDHHGVGLEAERAVVDDKPKPRNRTAGAERAKRRDEAVFAYGEPFSYHTVGPRLQRQPSLQSVQRLGAQPR